MLKDPIQMPKTVTCGPFLIYFYEKLSPPKKTAKFKLQEVDKQRHRDIA